MSTEQAHHPTYGATPGYMQRAQDQVRCDTRELEQVGLVQTTETQNPGQRRREKIEGTWKTCISFPVHNLGSIKHQFVVNLVDTYVLLSRRMYSKY